MDEMPAGSMRGLVLGVDDIDAMASDLHERGFLDDPTVHEEEWGRHFVVSDPDGNSILVDQHVCVGGPSTRSTRFRQDEQD